MKVRCISEFRYVGKASCLVVSTCGQVRKTMRLISSFVTSTRSPLASRCQTIPSSIFCMLCIEWVNKQYVVLNQSLWSFFGGKQLRRGNSHLGSASQDPEAFQEDPREEAEGGPPGERHGRRDQAGNLPDINTPEIAHPHPSHLS